MNTPLKLVLTWNYGDETCHCEHIEPFLYSSEEAAIVDFETACKKARNSDHSEFQFAGKEFYSHQFYEDGILYLPIIQTLDSWFEHNKD